MDRTREHGNFDVAHLRLGRDFFAQFVIQISFYLGETRSAEDLAVFTHMGCVLMKLVPFFLQDRLDLFKATVRLLQLFLFDCSHNRAHNRGQNEGQR